MHDGLGSVVGEVDVNGVLMCQKKTDVYGISRGNVGAALSRHGFVGGLGHYADDETSLVYMRARYYDPSLGMFVSEDPKLQGRNWFVYCDNNPTNMGDSSGKEEELVGTLGSMSISETMDGIAADMELQLLKDVKDMAGVLNEDAAFGVRQLEGEMGIGHGNWGYYAKEVAGGAGKQFLKAWVRSNQQLAIYDFYAVAEPGELFEHAVPYISSAM